MITTVGINNNVLDNVLYMAMELSQNKWCLAFGNGVKLRQVTLDSHDGLGLFGAIDKAKEKCNYSRPSGTTPRWGASSYKKSLDIITQKINELIETDKNLKEKKRVLLTVLGIGNIIANELLILVPDDYFIAIKKVTKHS